MPSVFESCRIATMSEKAWICSCGAFKVKLLGDPTLSLICHCHSCVAPCVRASLPSPPSPLWCFCRFIVLTDLHVLRR